MRTHGSRVLGVTLDPADDKAICEPRRASLVVGDSGILKIAVTFDRQVKAADGNLGTNDVIVTDSSGNPYTPTAVVSTAGDKGLEVQFAVGALPDGKVYRFSLAGKIVGMTASLTGDADCRVTALVADVNSDARVDSADVLLVKARLAKPLTEATAIYDLNWTV